MPSVATPLLTCFNFLTLSHYFLFLSHHSLFLSLSHFHCLDSPVLLLALYAHVCALNQLFLVRIGLAWCVQTVCLCVGLSVIGLGYWHS